MLLDESLLAAETQALRHDTEAALRNAPAIAQLRQTHRKDRTAAAERRTPPGQGIVAALSRLISGSTSCIARRTYSPSSSAHRSRESSPISPRDNSVHVRAARSRLSRGHSYARLGYTRSPRS